jgi:hypothetical protein
MTIVLPNNWNYNAFLSDCLENEFYLILPRYVKKCKEKSNELNQQDFIEVKD